MKKSDVHKKITHFARKWPGTVEKVSQGKDELKVPKLHNSICVAKAGVGKNSQWSSGHRQVP